MGGKIKHSFGRLIRGLKYKIKTIANMYLFSQIISRKNLHLGKDSHWNFGCWINAMGGIDIGANVIIGPYCHSANHKFNDINKPIRMQGHRMMRTKIDDDCWLGAGVIVIPGVIIGKGSVIGAGSVVTQNIPPYSLAVGNPAKVIQSRRKPEL